MLPTLATIWILHLVATMTPGANTVLVMQLAAGGVRGAAARATAGIATGSALWASLAVSGVGALFNAAPELRAAIQLAGGSYLVWLGGRFCVAAGSREPPVCGLDRGSRAFRVGLMTNLTNPKAVVFFGSIFATAFPADPPGWLPAAAILIVLLNAMSWYGLIAYLLSRESARAWYLRHSAYLSVAVGATLGGMGLALVRRAFRDLLP